MAIRTEVIKHAFECDGCDETFRVPSHDPEDMPPGYHIFVRRVTQAHNHYLSGALWFCSKDCLIYAMTYRMSAMANQHVGKMGGKK